MTRDSLSLRRVRMRLLAKKRAAELRVREQLHLEYQLTEYLSTNMLQWGTA